MPELANAGDRGVGPHRGRGHAADGCRQKHLDRLQDRTLPEHLSAGLVQGDHGPDGPSRHSVAQDSPPSQVSSFQIGTVALSVSMQNDAAANAAGR